MDNLISRRNLIAGAVGGVAATFVPSWSEAFVHRVIWRLLLRALIRAAVTSVQRQSRERTISRVNLNPAGRRIPRVDVGWGFTPLYDLRQVTHAHPSVVAVSDHASQLIRRHGVIALWVMNHGNFFAIEYENQTDRAVAGDLAFELRDLESGTSERIGSFAFAMNAHAKGYLPIDGTSHVEEYPCISGVKVPGAKIIRPYIVGDERIHFQEIGPVYVADETDVQHG